MEFKKRVTKVQKQLHEEEIMNYAPIQCSRLYNQGLWNIVKSENFWNVVIITVGLLICGTLTGL